MSIVTSNGKTLTRQEWLARRRESLGASEAAAALGVSPWQTPVELWQRKLGLIGEQDESEAMRWGSLLEPVILAEYQRRTGRRVVATQEFLSHPGYPFITATLDARCDDGRLVEVKTASAWAREWGDEGSDEVPETYLVQVAQQLAVTGAKVADVAVLIGGQRLRVFTVERDEILIEYVLMRGQRFWACVESREPPTWGRLDAASLAIRHPECAGDAMWSIEDAESVAAMVAQYETDGREAKLIDDRREHCKGLILAAMGSAQYGALPDGRRIKRFRQEVAERTVTYPVKAHIRHYFSITKGGES